MASSSITLGRTLEWAKRFVFQRPTANGNYNEPALTSANTILQTILGAPFFMEMESFSHRIRMCTGTTRLYHI